MFIKSNMNELVTYRKGSSCIDIKPNTVTFVDDTLVSAQELKDCYGDRINIISPELTQTIMEESYNVIGANLATPVPEILEDETPSEEQQVVQKIIDKEVAESDKEVEKTNIDLEWVAKQEAAKAYFANIEEDNDSDKHLKLAIAKRLQEEAAKDGMVYDDVSLMEDIEKVFPEEQAKIAKENEKQEKKNNAKEVKKTGRTSKTQSKAKNKQ